MLRSTYVLTTYFVVPTLSFVGTARSRFLPRVPKTYQDVSMLSACITSFSRECFEIHPRLNFVNSLHLREYLTMQLAKNNTKNMQEIRYQWLRSNARLENQRCLKINDTTEQNLIPTCICYQNATNQSLLVNAQRCTLEGTGCLTMESKFLLQRSRTSITICIWCRGIYFDAH